MVRYPNKTITKQQTNIPLVTKLDNGSSKRERAGNRTEPVTTLATNYKNSATDGQLLVVAGEFIDFQRKYGTGADPFILDHYKIIVPKTVAATSYEGTSFRLPSAGTYRLMLTQDCWNTDDRDFYATFFWKVFQYRNGVSLGTDVKTFRSVAFSFVTYGLGSGTPNHYQYVYMAVFEGNPGDIINIQAGSWEYSFGEIATPSKIFPEFLELQLIR